MEGIYGVADVHAVPFICGSLIAVDITQVPDSNSDQLKGFIVSEENCLITLTIRSQKLSVSEAVVLAVSDIIILLQIPVSSRVDSTSSHYYISPLQS